MQLVICVLLTSLASYAGPKSALDELNKRASSLQGGMGSDVVAKPSIECAGRTRQSGSHVQRIR